MKGCKLPVVHPKMALLSSQLAEGNCCDSSGVMFQSTSLGVFSSPPCLTTHFHTRASDPHWLGFASPLQQVHPLERVSFTHVVLVLSQSHFQATAFLQHFTIAQ